MQQAHVETLLLAGSLCSELFLFGVMFRKGLFRSFPLFTTYVAYGIFSDAAGFLAWHQASSSLYFYIYCGATAFDYALQLLVLYEIARTVLVPVRRSLPRNTLWGLLGAVCFSAVVASLAAPHISNYGLESFWVFTLRVTLVLVILRVVVFLLIAVFSQMLGIGWKNHVLQLASGFAFYGIVSIALQLSLRHISQPVGTGGYELEMHTLGQIQSLAFIGTLAFWSWAFSQNEAPRKEFTPQMQAVLVTIAGTARRTRLSVTRSQGQK